MSAPARATRRPTAGAQRLSASQRSAHGGRPDRHRPASRVLNAFRHHRGGHELHRRIDHLGRAHVLNAFRHHRGRHRHRTGCAIARRIRCSTPFGITEVGMTRGGGQAAAAASAQRLSASQRSALSTSRRMRSRTAACSTPFGITEVGIPSYDAAARRSRRWCSTPFGITEVGTRSLSSPSRMPVACAQRLSASQRSARALAGALRAGQLKCSTPFGITEVGTVRRVRDRRRPYCACSTPFGITEVGIRSSATQCTVASSVLNAFRHHRGGHYADVRADCRLSVCAQRLSASQRSAPIRRPLASSRRDTVLNAFRHHRGRHHPGQSIDRDADVRVLNAFRHHRGRHRLG